MNLNESKGDELFGKIDVNRIDVTKEPYKSIYEQIKKQSNEEQKEKLLALGDEEYNLKQREKALAERYEGCKELRQFVHEEERRLDSKQTQFKLEQQEELTKYKAQRSKINSEISHAKVELKTLERDIKDAATKLENIKKEHEATLKHIEELKSKHDSIIRFAKIVALEQTEHEDRIRVLIGDKESIIVKPIGYVAEQNLGAGQILIVKYSRSQQKIIRTAGLLVEIGSGTLKRDAHQKITIVNVPKPSGDIKPVVL